MHSHILVPLVCSEVIALAIHTKSDSCLQENLRCPKFLYRNYRPSPLQAKDVFSILALLIFTNCGCFPICHNTSFLLLPLFYIRSKKLFSCYWGHRALYRNDRFLSLSAVPLADESVMCTWSLGLQWFSLRKWE